MNSVERIKFFSETEQEEVGCPVLLMPCCLTPACPSSHCPSPCRAISLYTDLLHQSGKLMAAINLPSAFLPPLGTRSCCPPAAVRSNSGWRLRRRLRRRVAHLSRPPAGLARRGSFSRTSGHRTGRHCRERASRAACRMPSSVLFSLHRVVCRHPPLCLCGVCLRKGPQHAVLCRYHLLLRPPVHLPGGGRCGSRSCVLKFSPPHRRIDGLTMTIEPGQKVCNQRDAMQTCPLYMHVISLVPLYRRWASSGGRAPASRRRCCCSFGFSSSPPARSPSWPCRHFMPSFHAVTAL